MSDALRQGQAQLIFRTRPASSSARRRDHQQPYLKKDPQMAWL
jgi:hypothetical protein